ncbi:type I methionyl aminopeptidase [Patescibacteria group bacterium]|nr:type I methionyl aminopeptidase [Patescibacteria group bacterium]MCL5797263.1 type I methionyl aminopeptidase [Patescibacteria group bacterium]
MIHLKTVEEIEKMKKGGKILHDVLGILVKEAKLGVSLISLDQMAERLIVERGGTSSFKRVKGYHWTICSCVNDVVVHGIPDEYKIKTGDIVGIDCGVYFEGFHTDAAWTVSVGNSDSKVKKFLDTGEAAFRKAISQVKLGNYIYDISKAIQDTVEKEGGYGVSRTLVGHGVGRQLHEEPEVPGYVSSPSTSFHKFNRMDNLREEDEKLREQSIRESTPRLVPGLVIAIEVIYNMGSPDVVYKGNDGWTIVTKDGKISGLFEATVAVTSHGCVVLT